MQKNMSPQETHKEQQLRTKFAHFCTFPVIARSLMDVFPCPRIMRCFVLIYGLKRILKPSGKSTAFVILI